MLPAKYQPNPPGGSGRLKLSYPTSEGSNYPAHQHSFVRVYFANEV